MHASCAVHAIGQASRPGLALALDEGTRAEALATSQSAVDQLAEISISTSAASAKSRGSRGGRTQLLLPQDKWHSSTRALRRVSSVVINPTPEPARRRVLRVRQVLLGKRWMREHRVLVYRLLRGQLWPRRHATADPAPVRLRCLCLHAPQPAREGTARQRLLVAGGQPPPHLPIAGAYTARSVDQGAYPARRGSKAGRTRRHRCASLASATTAADRRAQIENVTPWPQRIPELDIRFQPS